MVEQNSNPGLSDFKTPTASALPSLLPGQLRVLECILPAGGWRRAGSHRGSGPLSVRQGWPYVPLGTKHCPRPERTCGFVGKQTHYHHFHYNKNSDCSPGRTPRKYPSKESFLKMSSELFWKRSQVEEVGKDTLGK